MVSCVHRKCHTRAGASVDINKSFECVTITAIKFTDRVLVWMTPKVTFISWVTIWLEQLYFCLNRCKWELPDQHIANCILPPEFFFNILIISTVCSHDMSLVTKLVYKAMFLISEPNSCWVPTLWLLWSDQHTYRFRCVVYNVIEVQHMRDIPPRVYEDQLQWVQ